MNNSVLLLNADGQPLSIVPLSTVSWQNAVKAMFAEKVRVIRNYDEEPPPATATNPVTKETGLILTEYSEKKITPDKTVSVPPNPSPFLTSGDPIHHHSSSLCTPDNHQFHSAQGTTGTKERSNTSASLSQARNSNVANRT